MIPMTKRRRLQRAAMAVVLVGAAVAPLRAELKYTMRMDMHKSSAPAPAAASDPTLAMMGALLAQTLFPSGPVEMIYTVGDTSTRVECPNGMAGLPAGTVLLQKADGSSVVLNPTNKTYWKIATPDMSQAAMGAMKVDVHPTTETATLLGLSAKRIGFDIHVPLPESVTVPGGLPKEFALEGDVWVTDRYKNYSQLSAMRVPGLSSLGLDKLPTQGLALKTVIHGAIFGDQELESLVTKISEEHVDASVFEIPAGYTEVPAPKIGGLR
jgi:hypothetical protein